MSSPDSPVAVVTGASSGLGRALSIALAREGYAVFLLARRQELLESAVAAIESDGGTADMAVCDVRDQAALRDAVHRARGSLGPVDLLVANAGVSARSRPGDADFADDVERLTRTNYLGAVYAVHAVLPEMLERGSGHLVAIGSAAGFRGLPSSAAYSASKGALANFFESLRIDLRGSGVAVTLVQPGYVRTPLTDRQTHAMPFMVSLDDAVDRIMRAIRARRRSLMFPWQVARAAWLAQIVPDALYDWIGSRVPRRNLPDRES